MKKIRHSTSNSKGFMLLEIIISFLIISISLGVIFQNISISLSSYEKAHSRLKNAFLLETIGMAKLLKSENPNEGEKEILEKEFPFEVGDKEYRFLQLSIDNKDSIFLFMGSESP